MLFANIFIRKRPVEPEKQAEQVEQAMTQTCTLFLTDKTDTKTIELTGELYLPLLGEHIIYKSQNYAVTNITHRITDDGLTDNQRIYADAVPAKPMPAPIASILNGGGKQDKRILKILKNAKHNMMLYEVVCTALMEMHNNPELSIYDAVQLGADEWLK